MLLRICFLVVSCFMLALSFRDVQSNRACTVSSKLTKSTNAKLIKYLGALRRIIIFSSDNKSDIDIDFYFGIFLANVNLKRALRDMDHVLPEKLRIVIREIIRKCEEITNFFITMLRRDSTDYNKSKAIFSLFANESDWIDRLPNFHMSPSNEAMSYLEYVKINWNSYTQNIDDVNSGLPNPGQSDMCLASLALDNYRSLNEETTERRCRVLPLCYVMLENGTDFGYALAHRLLFLQQARFGRGCLIYSEQEDKRMREIFCLLAYQEVFYIAMHDFKLVDLLMEHVCLCALEGHAQFLKSSWLEKILSFQTLPGCFSQHVQDRSTLPVWSVSRIWKLTKNEDQDILGGYCNGHTTALAAGILASTSRFLMESC